MKRIERRPEKVGKQKFKLNGVDLFHELDTRGLEPGYTGEHFIMALCPFHDDQSPSMSVDTRNGLFQCFGCEEKGDLADILAETDGTDRSSILKRIYREEQVDDIVADVYRSLRPREGPKVFSRRSFARNFPSVTRYRDAVKYLVNRGINRQSMERFYIRYAPSGKMGGRVVLPILTDIGDLVSYVGRTIRGDTPKTRKQGEKGWTLFGLYQLVRDCGKVEYLTLVEGEFDAIYLQQHGIAAVSVMGTAKITDSQVRLIRKYCSKVVLAYDGDDAGYKAVYGVKKPGNFHVLSKYLPTIPVTLPDGQDPNTLSEKEISTLFESYKCGALQGVYDDE